MKRISIVLVLLLNSCNQLITTQATNIKDTKVEEKNVLVNPVLPSPSPTPTPIITPVSSVLIINPSPSPSVSTSTSNSVNSQSTFINPVSSPKASNTPILPINPDVLPPTPPQANLSNGSAGPSISFADQPPPKPPDYSYVGQLPSETTRDGAIILINAPVKFKSLLYNIDVNLKSQIDSINQIMEEFNIKSSEVSTTSMTEEQAYEREKLIYDKTNYDAPNELSVYYIELKDKSISVLINKIRQISIIRECNFDYGFTLNSYNKLGK